MNELERCRAWIEAALEYGGGTHNFDDVVEAILSGKMQLWPAERACIVTEIVTYPRKRVLHVFLAGGELDQIIDMDTDVVQWAKEQGCESATQAGRKGWIRALKDHGWNSHLVLMEKRF